MQTLGVSIFWSDIVRVDCDASWEDLEVFTGQCCSSSTCLSVAS